MTLQATIIPPQFRRAHVEGMARYLASGHSTVIDRRIEISALHRDGHEFPIELAITRVQLDELDRYEFCAFIRDITQRKRAEEDIRASLEKQRELNQLKSRFVSMASHEFRTPLATILSSTELLRLYADRLPEAERDELFETVSMAVRRMTRMLEDVLVIGKDDAERRARGGCATSRARAALRGPVRRRPGAPHIWQPALQCSQVLAARQCGAVRC